MTMNNDDYVDQQRSHNVDDADNKETLRSPIKGKRLVFDPSTNSSSSRSLGQHAPPPSERVKKIRFAPTVKIVGSGTMAIPNDTFPSRRRRFQEQARTLRYAIGLYFLACMAGSFYLFCMMFRVTAPQPVTSKPVGQISTYTVADGTRLSLLRPPKRKLPQSSPPHNDDQEHNGGNQGESQSAQHAVELQVNKSRRTTPRQVFQDLPETHKRQSIEDKTPTIGEKHEQQPPLTTNGPVSPVIEDAAVLQPRYQPPPPLPFKQEKPVPSISSNNEQDPHLLQQPPEYPLPPAILENVSPVSESNNTFRYPTEEPVVQVITTRFMQHEHNLTDLGLARLELFRALCLPTMRQQTSHNFLWIIRVDPELATPVKEGLLNSLTESPVKTSSVDARMNASLAHHHATGINQLFRVVVIASNDNPQGFRRPMVDSPDQVWTNNYNMLKAYHEAAQTRIVLETRLDADDGLDLRFVQAIQYQAAEQLQTVYQHRQDNWLVWCMGTHVEWQYDLPWKNENSTTDEASQLGSLLPGLTRGCITPGLTKGYAPQANFDDIPVSQHQDVHRNMPFCVPLNETAPPGPSSWRQCLVVWKDLIPAAIRGRTPTSAGMQFVLGKHVSYLAKSSVDELGLNDPEQTKLLQRKQEKLWKSIARKFGISVEFVRSMRQYLKDHMIGIAKDNLEGQCTQGHSCKNSSRLILQEILNDAMKAQR